MPCPSRQIEGMDGRAVEGGLAPDKPSGLVPSEERFMPSLLTPNMSKNRKGEASDERGREGGKLGAMGKRKAGVGMLFNVPM